MATLDTDNNAFEDDSGDGDDDTYLTGQLLVAMPGIGDERFSKTVIYLCAHSEEGAMGLVINQEIDSLTFPDLLEQLGIEPDPVATQIQVQFGGPVESGRGFVLHSPDYVQDGTLVVDNSIALTATVDILRAIADGEGPRNTMLALGYAGWGPGQLDTEIRSNGWLHVPADDELVFGGDLDSKWERAMTKIGIDPRMLSDVAGNA
ncbi:MAG: YqgE/AlgH family protein [Rhodospirillales bacterium]|nr:YqgE/AlgH family protein [Rhodospirillales bacterium]